MRHQPLTDAHDTWLTRQEALGFLSPSTITNYRHGRATFVARHGDLEVGAVTRRHGKEWVNTFKGLASSTINCRIAAMHSFYADLLVDDLVDANPFDGIRRPRKRARTIRQPAPANVVGEVLRVADPRTKAMIALAYFAGFRRFEIAKCRESDIDWSDATISVIGKGDRPGTVPLPDQAVMILGDWVVWAPIPPGGFLFPSRGTHLTPQRVGEIMTDAATKCGVRVTPHQWRHRAGTDMAAAAGVKMAQMLLRHTSSSTTDGYVHAGVEDLRDAMNELHQ